MNWLHTDRIAGPGLAEIAYGLEVGRQPPRQPHQFYVPFCFPLKAPARLERLKRPISTGVIPANSSAFRTGLSADV
jgi:hypothetical protein